MNCEHCNKSFKTSSSLVLHQKTAKYCLKLRQAIVSNKSEEVNVLQQQILLLTQELNTIKQQLEESIKREQKIWDEYKEIASILAKKDTTVINKNKTNNTNINNLLSVIPLDLQNITREAVKQKIDDNFTIHHFNNGQKGVAQFAKDHILTDENGKIMYTCTDTARDMYKYLNENGDIEKDAKAKKLTNLISGDVIAKSHQIQQEGRDDLDDDVAIARITTHAEICHMRHDNSIFRSELSALMS